MDVNEAVVQQWRQELDNPTLGDRLTEHQKMVAMKYGLVAPQLTASEKNLVLREERKGARARR